MKTIKSALLAGLLFSFSITGLYAQDKDEQQDFYKEMSGLDAERNRELETVRAELNEELDAAMRESMEENKPGTFAEKRAILEQMYNEKVGRIEQNYLEKRSSMLSQNWRMKNKEQEKLSEAERELSMLDEEYTREMRQWKEEYDRENLQSREEFINERKEDKYHEKVNSLNNKYFEKAAQREAMYLEKRDRILNKHFGNEDDNKMKHHIKVIKKEEVRQDTDRIKHMETEKKTD